VIIESDCNVVHGNRVDTFNYTGENSPKSKFGRFQKKSNQFSFLFYLHNIFFSEYVDLG
jgi:hypothetical protein